MAVPEQKPIVIYIANGQSNRFTITFDLHDSRFLDVLVNKELAALSSFQIEDNKTVVFGVAPKTGDEIILSRSTTLDRPTKFDSYNNSFRPEAVNWDLDKIWHTLQEQYLIDAQFIARLKGEIETRRTSDSLLQHQIDILNDVLIGVFDKASSKYLVEKLKSLDEAINIAAATGAGENGWTDLLIQVEGGGNLREFNNNTVKTVDSVQDMIAIVTPKNGQVVETKSYHLALGRGGSRYIFDLSKVGINNKITVIKGWVLQSSDRICVTQAGCKLDDVADDSIAFNACASLDLPMCAKFSGRMRCLSPLKFNHNGFIGSGMFFQINVIGGHDGIILPLGGGRLFQNIERFFMISSDNSAQNHFAIRSQEVSNSETQSLGNGFKIRDIEIGGGGRFGCGIALTDCFRTSINDIGMTSCANAVILYGRVVQCKVGIVTSNSDEFAPSNINSTVLTKLIALPATVDKTKRYGLLVTGSTHTGTYQYPESIKSRDNAYVKHDYGLYHYDGLFCSYKDIDLDYNLIHGAYFYSCNGLVTLDTCWIAQNEGASHGIVIETSTAEAKRLILKGIYGLSYGELKPGSSIIYQSSDGVSAPARRGVEINGVTLASNYWTRGIDFNRMKDFSIKNFVEEGIPVDKGVSLLNCENFEYSDSISALSNIHTPTGEFKVSRITGEVTYNFLDFSTADRSRPTSTIIQNKILELQGYGGPWKAPIKFGGGYIWINADSELMMKAGTIAPTGDSDGIVIANKKAVT